MFNYVMYKYQLAVRGPATVPIQPIWDEEQLRAVGLAYRSARKRGLPDDALKAAMRVVVYCFPERPSEHGEIVSLMLVEAAQRWGGWLQGEGDEEPGEDLNRDDAG